MIRRLVTGLVASLLAVATPATAAAVGPGNVNHGGSPTANVTVMCALTEFDYDVLATINPDLVTQMVGNGEPVAKAWDKTSNKASALSEFLGDLYTGALPDTNVVSGEDLGGEGSPFVWVQVQVGYYDFNLNQFVILGSGTTRCKPGDLEL